MYIIYIYIIYIYIIYIYINIYIYMYIYDSQREKTFLKYFGLMPSSVICTKLFSHFFLYSTVNKKE